MENYAAGLKEYEKCETRHLFDLRKVSGEEMGDKLECMSRVSGTCPQFMFASLAYALSLAVGPHAVFEVT